MPVESIRLEPSAPATRCAFCHGDLEGEPRRCLACSATYHPECTRACVTFGCGGALSGEDPSAPSAAGPILAGIVVFFFSTLFLARLAPAFFFAGVVASAVLVLYGVLAASSRTGPRPRRSAPPVVPPVVTPVEAPTRERRVLRCERCDSPDLVLRATFAPHDGVPVQVEVQANPEALVFKGRTRVPLQGRVCVTCGHVELVVSPANAAILREAAPR